MASQLRLDRPSQEFSARDEGQMHAANQPTSTGLELARH
jgi:hypothetical protein